MKLATLFISKAHALRAAEKALRKESWTAAEPAYRVQRCPDTREVERGFAVRLFGADGSVCYL